MKARYLLDASAIYPLVLALKAQLLEYAELFATLDLAFYEVGNIVWKGHRRGHVKDPLAVIGLFQEVFDAIHVLRISREWMQDVLKLAIDEGLTFYDASYLYVSRTLGLKLVSEDSDLRRYPQSISVEELLEELE